MPGKRSEWEAEDWSETIYPDKLEFVPPKYAIVKRNEWMLKKSDFVIVYVEHSWGGAAKFMELAYRKNKTVINVADIKK